jgi:hypothetical protein
MIWRNILTLSSGLKSMLSVEKSGMIEVRAGALCEPIGARRRVKESRPLNGMFFFASVKRW